MKVVINTCYGGFGLSPEALLWLYEKGYRDAVFARPVDEYYSGSFGSHEKDLEEWNKYLKKGKQGSSSFLKVFSPDEKFVLNHYAFDDDRANPLLVECVTALGKKASGAHASLKIIKIPDDVKFIIEEYDGLEHVAEEHRTWSN